VALLTALYRSKQASILFCVLFQASSALADRATPTRPGQLSVAVKAAPAQSYTGREMLRDCSWVLKGWETDEQAATGLHCAAYVAGVTDGASITQDTYKREYDAPKLFCLPSAGLEEGQVVEIVLRWLEKNPERLPDSARAVIVQGLHNSFPCNR